MITGNESLSQDILGRADGQVNAKKERRKYRRLRRQRGFRKQRR